jgi:DNA polymerase-3 subunit delta
MYKREFENLLKKEMPKAVLFYGDNSYLISLYIQYYIKKTDTANSLKRDYFDDYDFKSAKEYLSQISLFGDANLLIIKRDKKLPKEELKTLLELVKKGSNNYLIFHYLGAIKNIKTMQSLFSSKNGAIWVRLFQPNMKESITLLQKKAKSIGLNINEYALKHLILLLNGNLTLCISELEKLAILGCKIEPQDIDRLVYSTTPIAIEQLLIKLFQKQPINEILNRLFELGEDEFSLLRSTQIFLNQIFLFNSYMSIHGYIDTKAILGYRLPKHIEKERIKLANRLTPQSILKIFELLLEVELKIKTTPPTNRDLILYGAFIRLQSYL